jgi:hypothetical protein
MLVTQSGMVTEVRAEQPEKAASRIPVLLFLTVTGANVSQPEKALFPILVALPGTVTEVRALQPVKQTAFSQSLRIKLLIRINTGHTNKPF